MLTQQDIGVAEYMRWVLRIVIKLSNPLLSKIFSRQSLLRTPALKMSFPFYGQEGISIFRILTLHAFIFQAIFSCFGGRQVVGI